MFLKTSRHMPRYAGAAEARMKRGAVSRTVASFVLAIGNPRHAVAGWIDWVGAWGYARIESGLTFFKFVPIV